MAKVTTHKQALELRLEQATNRLNEVTATLLRNAEESELLSARGDIELGRINALKKELAKLEELEPDPNVVHKVKYVVHGTLDELATDIADVRSVLNQRGPLGGCYDKITFTATDENGFEHNIAINIYDLNMQAKDGSYRERISPR